MCTQTSPVTNSQGSRITTAFPSSQLVQLPVCFPLPSLSIIYSELCLLREAARCSLIPHSGRVCVVAGTWNRVSSTAYCFAYYSIGEKWHLTSWWGPMAGRVSVRVELFHAWVQHLARLCDRYEKQLACNVDFRMPHFADRAQICQLHAVNVNVGIRDCVRKRILTM